MDMIDGEKSHKDVKKSQKIAKSMQKKQLRQSKKKNGSKGGKMTSDEKKPTETNVPMSILVGEIFFFFSLEPYFSR